MKKTLSIILTLCILLGTISTGLFGVTASAESIYTITYHLDGGTNALKNPDAYTSEDTVVLLDATKEGYDFAGWFIDPNKTEQITEISSLGNVNVYAKFTPKTYSAIFNDNGATSSSSICIKLNSLGQIKEVLKNNGGVFDPYSYWVPSRSGYVFLGWYNNSELVSGPLKISQDLFLEAKWSKCNQEYNAGILGLNSNSIEVSADSYDGEDSCTTYVYISADITRVHYEGESVKKTLYYKNQYYTTISGNFQIYDVTNQRTLVYGADGGGKKSGDLIVDPGTLLRITASGESAYIGLGYSANGKCVLTAGNRRSSNITVSNQRLIEQEFDSMISAPVVDKNGYQLLGWYDSQENQMTDTWQYAEDETFTAKWELLNYDITYELGGGVNNVSNPTSYTIEDSITLNDPTKPGYTFEGWYSDTDFTKKVTTIKNRTGKITLYAKWAVNSYSLTLDGNSGTFAPKVTFISDGKEVKCAYLYEGDSLTAYRPESKSGYIFAGWYTDDTFTTLFKFNGTIKNDTTLYAKWVECSSNIISIETTDSFDVDVQGKTEQLYAFVPFVDGKITITSESGGLDLYGILYDSSKNILVSSDDISDTDLDFTYSYNVKSGQLYYISVKGNMSLTSGAANIAIQWDGSCTITGTTYTDRTITVVYDAEFKLPDNPVREGFKFFGWFDENGDQITDGVWNFASDKTLTAKWGVLLSIDITTKPDKLNYIIGDAFDTTGMVVTARYSNGVSKVITDYTISGYSSTAGTKTIVISYGNLTTSFDVTVEDCFKIKSVSHELSDDKVIFTVVTTPNFNRVKVTTADNLSSYIAYTSKYTTDASGNYVFTVSVPAIVGTTEYAFDGRKADTNQYAKDYFYYVTEIEEELPAIISVSHVISGGKIAFTVITKPDDYSRVKVTTADNLSGSVGVASSYTVNADGNYVWTIKATAPTETTSYAFDLRSAETGKYLKEYYYADVEVTEPIEIFKSTSYEIVDGKVILTVVTSAGDYNRVKIALTDNITSYVKYVDTYTVNADGDYVWTLKFNAPTTVTEYALDVRLASTKKYVKDYHYVTINPIVEEPETVYVSANGEIKDGKLVFTIVTKPTDINRIKVMLTSDQSSYVKLISSYTVNANGNYVWTASIAAPSETTSYTLDVRSSTTQKYLKDFYTFDVAVVEEVELYKSVSYEIVNGKIVFTVVTAAGDYDRIKVTTSANLGGSLGVGSYTVDANGDYVWTIKATAPTEATEYAFDLRVAGGKYLKDYYKYNVTL